MTTASILDVRGLSQRAVSEPARSVVTRLGLRSALREVAESGLSVVFAQVDGSQLRGVVLRVGADFVEIREETGLDTTYDTIKQRGDLEIHVLPFAALAAARAT